AARGRAAGQAREPDVTARCRIRIDRKRARPYDGHRRLRLGSLLAIGATRGEEESLTLHGDTTILTRLQAGREGPSSKSTARHPAGTTTQQSLSSATSR